MKKALPLILAIFLGGCNKVNDNAFYAINDNNSSYIESESSRSYVPQVQPKEIINPSIHDGTYSVTLEFSNEVSKAKDSYITKVLVQNGAITNIKVPNGAWLSTKVLSVHQEGEKVYYTIPNILTDSRAQSNEIKLMSMVPETSL